MGLWIKWDANAHKDATIASLTDTQRWAFIVALSEAKQMRNGGRFESRKHLAAVLGTRLARAVPALIAKRLLTEDETGLVSVSNWSRWQVDPTSGERTRSWRARNGAMGRFGDALEQSRAEREKRESLIKPRAMQSAGEILLGRKR